MKYRSERFKQIAAQVEDDYLGAPDRGAWYRRIAPRWRHRVGIPRLIAENATLDVIGTFRSINRGLFRDPAERERYDRAVAALNEFSVEFSRENWRRFNGEPKPSSDEAARPAEPSSQSPDSTAISATVEDPEQLVHACPTSDDGVTSCCGRLTFELPLTDRMTLDAGLVTCTGPRQWWEYGFYDSEDPQTPPTIWWYCFGLPFTSAEMATHTGLKSTWGHPVIVRRRNGSETWEHVLTEDDTDAEPGATDG